VISIIWLWGSLFIAGFFPIIDGQDQIVSIFRALRRGGSSKKNQVDDTKEGKGVGSYTSKETTIASISKGFMEK